MRDLNPKKVARPTVSNRKKPEKKQRRPVNWRRLLKRTAQVTGGTLALLLAVVAGREAWGYLGHVSFFRLERIEVNSRQLVRLTRDEVIDLAGVRIGDGLLGLRLREVAAHLAKNPWVATVKVRRYFPHTLVVELSEREPVAVVNLGYLYYLGTEADIFKPLSLGDSLDYPVVTGFSEEDLTRDPAGTREALRATVKLIALLRGSSPFGLAEVSEVHYDRGYGFTLFAVQGGVPVRLGNTDLPGKLARLGKIYKELQAQLPALDYIDLDYTDKIIVKKV